jgi:hypothetical protein
MSDLPPNPSQTPEPKSLTSRPPPAGRLDAILGGVDRVARLQTIAAVVLGLALIAIPLYLWRRPRSESPPVTSALTSSGALDAGVPDAAGVGAALPGPTVSLSDPKVMECHDTGSRHTRPEDCDHLAAVEKGLATAINASASCLPTSTGGGTLVYVVDASFARKRHPIELIVPRDGRSLKNAHGAAAAAAVSGCMATVKKGMESVALDGVPHAHARYRVAITATYAAYATPQ